jgi:kynureninase
MKQPGTLEHARELDLSDPLARFRQQFVIRDPSLIYLDGNSLGRLPVKAAEAIERSVREQWGEQLIRSWNLEWYTQSARLGRMIAGIIGAQPDEVIVSDSTSVNLYKLACGALRIMEGRTEIISDDMNFPSDLYILEGLIRQMGGQHKLKLVKSPHGISTDMSGLARMISRRTALVTLSHVTYKSAFLYDMKQVTDLAHEQGALVLWDLSHSAGVVPVQLEQSGADLAVGCTYKYLNGGPGSPAYLYVRRALQERLENPIQGWFGEKNPFEFQVQFRKSEGIRKFLTGTPPVISSAGLAPALSMIQEAGVGPIREKSMTQTGYVCSLAQQWLYGEGMQTGSPEQPEQRGSHITLKHPEAYRISRALIDPAVGDFVVIPDFREPDNLRFGFSPLYTSYEEIYHAMRMLRDILRGKTYQRYSSSRDAVT